MVLDEIVRKKLLESGYHPPSQCPIQGKDCDKCESLLEDEKQKIASKDYISERIVEILDRASNEIDVLTEGRVCFLSLMTQPGISKKMEEEGEDEYKDRLLSSMIEPAVYANAKRGMHTKDAIFPLFSLFHEHPDLFLMLLKAAHVGTMGEKVAFFAWDTEPNLLQDDEMVKKLEEAYEKMGGQRARMLLNIFKAKQYICQKYAAEAAKVSDMYDKGLDPDKEKKRKEDNSPEVA